VLDALDLGWLLAVKMGATLEIEYERTQRMTLVSCFPDG